MEIENKKIPRFAREEAAGQRVRTSPSSLEMHRGASFPGLAVAARCLVAFGGAALAARWPAAGLALGAALALLAVTRRTLPSTVLVAALAALAAAALLPALALSRDPFHAHRATTGWPLFAVSLAALGAGGAVWSLWPTEAFGPPAFRAISRGRVERWLGWALAAVALLLPLGIAPTQLALAAVAVLWLLLRPSWRNGATRLDAPVLALLGVSLFSIALSPEPTPPWDTTALRALLALLVLPRALAAAEPGERGLLRLVALWAAASAAVSVLAFAQHWTGFDLLAALHLRVAVHVPAPESPGHLAGVGTFASRLTFAHATVLGFALLLGIQLAGPPRALLALAMLLQLAGIWATFARAAWLAVAALLSVAVLLAFAQRDRGRLLVGLGAAAAAVVLLFALVPGTRAWGLAALRPGANPDRLFLWARGAEVALDHPWHGVGLGSYHLLLGPYYDRFDPGFPMRTWAHDMPLSLLAETGPLGLFAYAWLLVEGLALGVRGWRRRVPGWNLALGGALAVVAFALISTFHDALYDGQVAFTLAFALALAAQAESRAVEAERPSL